MSQIITYIINKMKESRGLLNLVSRIYTSWYSPKLLFGGGGGEIVTTGAFLKRVKIKVQGRNNSVIISSKVMMNDSVISVSGDNCRVMIEGGGTNIHHCNMEVRGNGSVVMICKGFTSEQVSFHACEGRKITVGEDCMFSAGIYITTSDFHAIVDEQTQERINNAKDVVIGNHVWLAHGVSVMKGVVIAEQVVVGKGSTVTGALSQSHAIYAGTPAKKVKEVVSWKREI